MIPNWGIFSLDLKSPVNYNSIPYYFFLTYIVSYMFLYGAILHHRHESADNIQSRKNMQLILIGTILSLLTAFVTNVIIPFLYKDLSFVYYGPVATLFLSFMVIFAMLKYRLFHIKLPIAGLLITLIITIMLLITRFFIIDSTSISSIQFNFLVIFMFGFLYVFLTREVYLGAKNQLILDSKQKQLETVLDSKNDFLKNSSHQFRTPLTVILGYLGMIIDRDNPKYELNQQAINDLSKTYASAKNLNEIINDVLDSNDINTGRFGINIRDNIDLKDLIDSILIEKKELLSQKSTTVKIKSTGKDFIAFVDRNKLKEGLNNIIDNSIFYGNGRVNIHIDSTDSKFFYISIKDNGVGISKSEAQTIWRKFERGKKSSLINPNGSGLGLYLTKQIMLKHGGDIIAHSGGRNKGSIFTLSIPKNTRKYAPSDSFGVNIVN
jgi:signal transduction histidine kinase